MSGSIGLYLRPLRERRNIRKRRNEERRNEERRPRDPRMYRRPEFRPPYAQQLMPTSQENAQVFSTTKVWPCCVLGTMVSR
ncbi:hypothetical protein TNCV_1462621 [Trichonephila clavipes]|nr:hypothetical protein TNCV_1462621 [Trichonephila clavipes]